MNGKFFIGILVIFFMAAYPIYKNFYYGRAITTYERHIAILEKKSEYFNPWQYRVLSPSLVEATLFMYNHTIDKIYPIEKKLGYKFNETSRPTPETAELMEVLQHKGALKYMIVFTLLRWVINIVLLVLAFRYYSLFSNNKYLVWLALGVTTLAMGNGVLASDLTFNTYLDNIFYLTLGYIVLKRKNPIYLIPLTVLAAFNRETSILIPALFFVSYLSVESFSLKGMSKIIWPEKKIWLITIISYVLFAAIFVGIRLHFGYQSAQVWKVPSGLPMLKLNLFSAVAVKNVFEIYGVICIFPFIILMGYKYNSLLLKKWFLLLVPVWFLIHFYAVVAYQARLFMVPLFLIMIPMVLEIISKSEYDSFRLQKSPVPENR